MLTPRARGYWYMCSGFFCMSQYARGVRSFTSKDTAVLRKLLESKFKIKTSQTYDPMMKCPVIEIAYGSSLRFKRILLHYIHPSLWYKI